LSLFPALGADVPRQAPEFVVNLPDGGQKLLSSYRGKVVVLEFLYTTCPHCQEASRMMAKLQKEYGPKGFQALGVAFNPMSKMLVPDFVRTYGANYPVGFAEREPVAVFLQLPAHEALHVPQMVFIDRKGVIRKQSLPRGDGTTAQEQNVRALVEKLLAEPTPSSNRSKSTGTKKRSS
jgi:peroxiredoxin